MGRVKLDQEILGLSNLFERETRARVMDCFRDGDAIFFIVAAGQIGKAIGKGGVNIKKLQNSTGKKIRIIEYQDKVESFVKNVIYPVNVQEIVLEGNTLFIRDSSKKTKSLLIGRNGINLQRIKRAVQRFYTVDEVKVE